MSMLKSRAFAALNHQEFGLSLMSFAMAAFALGACYSSHDLLTLMVAEMPEELRFQFEVVRIATGILGLILTILAVKFIWMARTMVAIDRRTAFLWVFIILAAGFGALFLMNSVLTHLNDLISTMSAG